MDKVREALADMQDAIALEGFGCACLPNFECGTCKARDSLRLVNKPFAALRAAIAAQAKTLQDSEAHGLAKWQTLLAERDALRAQVEAAVPAMREYARQNPRWIDLRHDEGSRGFQDPNGAHAWLAAIDAASKGPAP